MSEGPFVLGGWGGRGPFVEVSACQGVPLLGMGGALHWGVPVSGGPHVRGSLFWGVGGVLLLGGAPFIEVSHGWGVPMSGGPFVGDGGEGVLLLGGGPFIEVSPCQGVPLFWGCGGGGGPFVGGVPLLRGWGLPSLRCPHVRGSLVWGVVGVVLLRGVPSLRCPHVGGSLCWGGGASLH